MRIPPESASTLPAADAMPAADAALPAADAALPATRLDLMLQALLGELAFAWRVEAVGPGSTALRAGRRRVVLLDAAAAPWPAVATLDRMRRGAFPARHVVVLGSDPVLSERIQAAASDLAARGIWVLHVDGHTSPRQSRPPRWNDRRLARVLTTSAERAFERATWSRAEAATQARRVELDQESWRRDAEELERFRALLGRRRPRVTVALLGLIAAVFALEAWWGATDLPPLLARMGSLLGDPARRGEWWRYFSCTFLHAGVLHVGLNGLVLYMLGRSLERFVGSTRFMLIYFAAGLAGSVASAVFVSSQSVGASGAIWGLLGAEAALAFYPRPLLPPALIGLSRRTAATNLGINLAISFNPHIDAAAHIGGGLMGAAVLATLALSGRLSSHGRAAPPVGWALRALAGALAGLFCIGLLVALIQGRPWELGAAPTLERVTLSGSPWSVEVPRGHVQRQADPGGSRTFGSLSHDASVVDIRWLPLADQDKGRDVSDELSSIVSELKELPAGLEQLIPPRIVENPERPDRPLVMVRYRISGDTDRVQELAVGLVDGNEVSVNVSGWAELPRAFDGLAARISRSFAPASADSARRAPAALGSVFHSGVPSPGGVGGGR
jgi:rhomboid protease GluP